MHPAGQAFAYIQAQIGDTSDETLAIIKDAVNAAYFDMCAMRAWSPLRKRATLTFTASQTTGTILDSDLEDIYYMSDEGDPVYEWIRSDEEGRYVDTVTRKWYWDMVHAVTALASASDVTLTANSTAVTSSGPSFPDPAATDCTGEYIRFGDNLGVYEIAAHASTAALTLVNAYRGDSVAGTSYFEIRPPAYTKRILIDPADAETVYMHYWTKPLPLYNSYDMVLLPGTGRALWIKALQYLLRMQKYDTDAERLEREYMMAEGEMYAREPRTRPAVPTNAAGTRLAFGRLSRA